MIILRVIPFEVPTIDSLGLPESTKRLAESERGLVIVSGGFSSGKSSAIAALLHHANAFTQRHIVTLENPIEFLHRDIKCSITQREVGVDTTTLRAGLQAALRQDSDVVVMENLQDPDALEYALQSVERGRLVISSLVARDVQATLESVVSMAPEKDGGMLRARVAAAMHAVLALRLVPRADGSGRVLVTELAVMDPDIRELVLDPRGTAQIGAYLASGRGDPDNHTFTQRLSLLAGDGIVKGEVARVVTEGTSVLDVFEGEGAIRVF
jgi:twitching motility protein PilT